MLLRAGRNGLGSASEELHCARAQASQRGHRAFELQVALPLAQLIAENGNRPRAREILRPIARRFDSVDTRDAFDASKLMDLLALRARHRQCSGLRLVALGTVPQGDIL